MGDTADDPDDTEMTAYIRGTLPPGRAAEIAADAARRPELAAEIALLRGIAAVADDEARATVPGELGWARLSRALDAEPRRTAGPGRWRPLWPLAASAVVAIAIWQALAVPFLSGDGQARYAPVSEQSAGATLAVAFKPQATEPAIRELLRSVDGQITGGPSAIGLWQVSFASDAARDAALSRLTAADIVDSAQTQ